MRYFCTYFDKKYLSRGILLYESLKQHCTSFRLWVLCLDAEVYHKLLELDLPEVRPITLDALERNDAPLRAVKTNRTLVEYFLTCTPSLLLYVLQNNPAVDLITYVDADLFFFADVEPLFEEMGDRSIAIIEHRHPAANRHLEVYGRFNVGFVSFRRDRNGLSCLAWWRERCLEWCRLAPPVDGRYGDQKYLDDWPTRFRNVAVLEHKGADLGPWNLARYRVSRVGSEVRVDEQPLIFFHFHGLHHVRSWLIDLNLASYGARPSGAAIRHIFAPYVHQLRQVRTRLADPPLAAPAIAPNGSVNRSSSVLPRAWLRVRSGLVAAAIIGSMRNQYVVVFDRFLLCPAMTPAIAVAIGRRLLRLMPSRALASALFSLRRSFVHAGELNASVKTSKSHGSAPGEPDVRSFTDFHANSTHLARVRRALRRVTQRTKK